MIEQAYKEIFPDREFKYMARLRYSGHFSGYNANIKQDGTTLTISLSKSWKGVSREIQIGLIQSLLVKLFKSKKQTMNMDLYEIFIKNAHISALKTNFDPLLADSFNRVNNKYFYGLIEMPNLCFTGNSRSKLGSYEYGSDTITISGALRNAPTEILDYVMYHEMLHKRYKFRIRGGKSYHHTGAFRKQEKQFENREAEEQLKRFLRRRSLWFYRRNI